MTALNTVQRPFPMAGERPLHNTGKAGAAFTLGQKQRR